MDFFKIVVAKKSSPGDGLHRCPNTVLDARHKIAYFTWPGLTTLIIFDAFSYCNCPSASKPVIVIRTDM
jgi:hypothetical protein